MSTPYSSDLRERVVAAHLAGQGTYEELAALFDIGEATVSRWLGRHRRTGSVEPDPHGGGNPALIPDELLPTLRGLVERHPDATQYELCDIWLEAVGVEVSRSVIARALRRAGITRKKNGSAPPSSSGRTSKRHAPRSRS
jgi:transposase